MQQTYLTEILKKGDPTINSDKAEDAVRKELEELYNQGFLKEMKHKNNPDKAIILPSRFVYTMKNARRLEELYRARYTAGGHIDFMESMMIHDSTNLRHGSIRLISSTAANFGWIIWTKDVIQADIQREDMTRFIVLIPPPELEIPPEEVLKVCKFLYRLSEAGDVWHHKLRKEIHSKLNLHGLTGDQALYTTKKPSDLCDCIIDKEQSLSEASETAPCEGIIGTYVDDLLFCGTEKFRQKARSSMRA